MLWLVLVEVLLAFWLAIVCFMSEVQAFVDFVCYECVLSQSQASLQNNARDADPEIIQPRE